MVDILQQIFSFVFGLLMVIGLCGFIYKRHAQEWEQLARVYGRKWTPPIAVKHRRSMVLHKEGEPARTYAGIVTLGVYSDGIGLKPIPWLAPFHSPVFIPFGDIKGWQQKWYWDGPSVELVFSKTPALQIIMPAKQIDWISSQQPGEIPLSAEVSPRTNWPWATQAMAFVSLFMVVTVIAISAYKYANL